LIPTEKAKPLLGFLDSLNAVIIKVLQLIMYSAPVGVFALLADTVTLISEDNLSELWGLLGALGFYMLVVLAGLILHMTITYGSIVGFLTPVSLIRFIKGIAPAQLVAFSTSSSGATLPVTMEMSTADAPSTTTPSVAILSPGRTTNLSPTCRPATGASVPFSKRATGATSAANARRASPDRRRTRFGHP